MAATFLQSLRLFNFAPNLLISLAQPLLQTP
jgi:hypothetical protein